MVTKEYVYAILIILGIFVFFCIGLGYSFELVGSCESKCSEKGLYYHSFDLEKKECRCSHFTSKERNEMTTKVVD